MAYFKFTYSVRMKLVCYLIDMIIFQANSIEGLTYEPINTQKSFGHYRDTALLLSHLFHLFAIFYHSG